ncbi:MAG: hypothetical protein MCM46_12805 [Candidatus Manganitrophus sp. SB1]|nr:hypothetical protein [Candidatus Manganitrophus morganii]
MYSAQGAYSDGTTKEITSLVQWRIEAPTSIGYFSGSEAKGTELGTGTIEAILQGVTGAASLTVREPELIAFSVSPTDQRIGVGSIHDFVTNGWFTDFSFDYPTPISCRLSDATVAIIIEVGESHCRIQGLSAGTATLSLFSASSEFSADATIEVLPLTPFGSRAAHWTPEMKIGVDETGAPVVVFRVPFDGTGDLFWSRRAEDGNWSAQATISAKPVGGWESFVMDLALDGSILLVGTGAHGIYSTQYLPGQGWQELETVSEKTLVPFEFGGAFEVGYDAEGNGIAMWTDDANIFSSEYHAGSGWSAPVDWGSGYYPVLAMNESGKAILVWHKFTGIVSGDGFDAPIHRPYAVTYTVGTGWTVPVVLDSFDFASNPTAAMNESGEAIAVWQRVHSYEILTSRLLADGSWTPAEVLSDDLMPCVGSVAIDVQGNVLLLCNRSYRYLVGSGWQAPASIEIPIPGQLEVDRQGDTVIVWPYGSPEGPEVKISRFDHVHGWQPDETLAIPRGGTTRIPFAMNSAGNAAMAWASNFQLWNSGRKVFEDYHEIYIQTVPSD